jgi:hypothetical protein
MNTLMDAPAVDDPLRVLDGIECKGHINTTDEAILANIAHAIRQHCPQVRPEPLKGDRVAIVGSGPSLEETLPELRALIFDGVKVVALNGAYQWCIDHNIHPSAVVMVDARATNARFVATAVPRCKYFIASQCHPDVFAALEGRDVLIWHATNPDCPEGALLDEFYGAGRWAGIAGGTTVATRAIGLLRTIGYLRFDLFGVDSCWLDGQHHAFAQAENATEKQATVRVSRGDGPAREFVCAPWHVKQFEDVLQLIRISGHQFQLAIHGRGLLAAAIGNDATVSILEGD